MASNILAVVQHDNGILVVDSRLIAQDLGIDHSNFLETVQKYQDQIEQAFGVLRFQTEKPSQDSRGGRPARFAYLTEDQATFIMTLSRNSERVVQCKLGLVQAFSRAKQALAAPPSTQAEMLVVWAQHFVEQERRTTRLEVANEETQQRLVAVEAEQDRYQSPSGKMFTVLAYANLLGRQISLPQSIALGKKATALCSDHGLKTDSVRDPRFGSVKTYPQDALAEVFGEALPY